MFLLNLLRLTPNIIFGASTTLNFFFLHQLAERGDTSLAIQNIIFKFKSSNLDLHVIDYLQSVPFKISNISLKQAQKLSTPNQFHFYHRQLF